MPVGSVAVEGDGFHPATVVLSCRNRKDEEDQETLQPHVSNLPTFFYLLSFAPPLPSLIKSPKDFFNHPIILYIIGTICAMLGGFSSFPVLDLIFGVYWSNRIADGASSHTISYASNFSGIIAIITAFGCFLFTWIFQVCFQKASEQLTKRLRYSYVASVLSQDASYFDLHGAGEVATHAGKEMHTIRVGLGEKLGFTIWTMTVLLISLIIGFSVAAKVAGFLFTSVPLIIIVFGLLGIATEKVGAPALRLEGRASTFVEEIFGLMRIVQSFGMSTGLLHKYDKEMLAKSQGYGQRKAFIRGLEAGVVYLALFSVYSAAFWFIGVHTANGSLQLGNGLTAFWNLVNALFSFSMTVPQISSIFEAMSAIRLIRRAIERQPKIDVRDRSGLQIEDNQLVAEFELQDINFAYASRSHSHSLRNVSIKLDAGKVTALVGPSGSGKSTITSLLLREYDPETANIAVASDAAILAQEEKEDAKAGKQSKKIKEKEISELSEEEKAERAEEGALSKPVEIVQGGGLVLYSGQDVRKLNLRWLRSQLAIVRQDPQIFTASIFENVAAGLSGTEWAYRSDVDGSKDASEDVQARTAIIRQKVKDALWKAQALAFVEKLPEGIDTEVSGGKTGLLSGGQRQRISLARALVRQPKVLVIDEGTSAIDSNTEEKIRLMLQEEHKQRGMTVCLIAHRLSTVEKADNIIVMKNGSVVDQGTHKELMQSKRKDQTYRSMVMHQRALVETNDSDDTSSDEQECGSRSGLPDHLPSDESTIKAPTSTVASLEPLLPLQRLRLPARRPSDYTSWTVSGRSISFGQAEHVTESSSIKTDLHKTLLHPAIATEQDPQPTKEQKLSSRLNQSNSNVETPPKELRKNFFKLLVKHKYEFIIGVSGAVVAGLVFPAMGLVTGLNVNALNAPTPELIRKGTRLWSLISLCLAFADLFIVLIQSFALESASEKMNRHLKRTALSSLMKQEIGFFDSRDNASGALAADLTTHPANVTAASGLVLSQILISTVNLVGSVILAFVLSWKMALVVLSPVVVLFVTGWLNVTMLEKYEHSLQGPSSQAASYISENVDAIKEVVALGRERETLRIFEEQARSASPKQTRYLIYGAGGFSLSQAAVYATASLIFFYGGYLRADDKISVTALYSIFECAIIGIFSAGRIFTFTSDFGRAAASFKTLCGWYERKAKIQTLEMVAEKHDESWLGNDIVFRDVELRYPRRPNHPAISNLNLTIHSGQSHAFCGTSGSGKSTILQMVQRFYDPHCGTITVGEQDIRSIDLDELRNEMSYVSQDACLYDGSIKFNLLLGAAKGQQVSQEEIESCCEQACIADFIRGLPKGYDTEIGHKGAQLSGGQKQRICIARALIKRPKMILLDEATSALDAQSEVSVQRALDNASIGRTTLTVAHRLSTIRNCDIIHVVEDGAIVESGTHSDLVQRRGRYLQLIQAQI